MASLNANKAAASATTVYDPYRIFQAAQRCMGEPTMVAKVLVELLGEWSGVEWSGVQWSGGTKEKKTVKNQPTNPREDRRALKVWCYLEISRK